MDEPYEWTISYSYLWFIYEATETEEAKIIHSESNKQDIQDLNLTTLIPNLFLIPLKHSTLALL